MCCKVLRQYGEVTDTEPGAMATNVEETEETLPDGTVVKRRVVTTTQQQLTTERVVLEPDDEWNSSRVLDDDDDDDGDGGVYQPVFQYTDNGMCVCVCMCVCICVCGKILSIYQRDRCKSATEYVKKNF